MPASRAPAALTATIVLLATLIVCSFFAALAVVADLRVAVVAGIGIGAIALLIAWGVRGA